MATRARSGRSGRAAPLVVTQGLAIWGIYELLRRLVRPFDYLKTQLGRALFGWKDYGKYVREQAVVEGILSGNTKWLGIGAVVYGVRAMRRSWHGTEQIVLREALQPGEQLVITQIPRKVTRKQRKAGTAPRPVVATVSATRPPTRKAAKQQRKAARKGG